MLVDNFLVHSAVVLEISLAFGYLLMGWSKSQQSRKATIFRRPGPSPLLCSSSTSAILSSVIGPRSARVKHRKLHLGRLPGDHLSLTRGPGAMLWGIPPDARLPPNFHHKRGR